MKNIIKYIIGCFGPKKTQGTPEFLLEETGAKYFRFLSEEEDMVETTASNLEAAAAILLQEAKELQYKASVENNKNNSNAVIQELDKRRALSLRESALQKQNEAKDLKQEAGWIRDERDSKIVTFKKWDGTMTYITREPSPEQLAEEKARQWEGKKILEKGEILLEKKTEHEACNDCIDHRCKYRVIVMYGSTPYILSVSEKVKYQKVGTYQAERSLPSFGASGDAGMETHNIYATDFIGSKIVIWATSSVAQMTQEELLAIEKHGQLG